MGKLSVHLTKTTTYGMKTALRRTKVPGGMNNAMAATLMVNISVERILQ